MDFDVAILSPEKAILTYRVAGLGSRVLAHLVDCVILALCVGAGCMGIAYVFARMDMEFGTGMILFISFILPFLYFVLFEGLWNGQTIGKKMAGVRVRMTDGTPITFLAALGRNIMRPADMLPGLYFLGVLAMFTNTKAQRIGDLISNTMVCYERRPVPNFVAAPHAAGIHPLEQYVGDLRGMTLEEYNALRRFADRFPELSQTIQERLLNEIWYPIAERRNIPSLPNVHPIYLMEAVVMKWGRSKGIL